ncbi:MAG: carbon-nitrogen hydrolase family protein [Tannerella sp.]|nr:carbon-nitrogen hydrolase family protein [Tannerella sp.]
MKKYLILCFFWCSVMNILAQTTAYQSDFTKGKTGALPDGWTLTTFQPEHAPRFELKSDTAGTYLSLKGNGDASAVAYISTHTQLAPGTYAFRALFSISNDVNPQRNLLFQCKASTHDGIFKFYKLDGEMVEGRGTIVVTGNILQETELRVFYRLNGAGEAKLRSLSITPTEPEKSRWVRFACTQGNMNTVQMVAIAEQAASDSADLLLYPEHVAQKSGDASNGDSLLHLLSDIAIKYRMYIAASVLVIDKTDGRKYNRGVLYNRTGELIGVYDKIHPYSPEINDKGVTPGTKTDVFNTEFGKIGMIICYDSWFTDITELLALKGAEVILFPVAGYYRSLIHARAADNNVRFVISVLDRSYGIFDTAGRDIQAIDKDPSVGVSGNTAKDIRTFNVNGIGLLCASLDLNCSPSPHYNGGKMLEAPGGKRNRADQILYLDNLIKKEKERWWEN